MEPAHNSETTMSERPYLTFRNASRRARGRGMARVAAAREELCKKRRATRVFATTVAGRRLAALLTRYGCSDAHSQFLVSLPKTPATPVFPAVIVLRPAFSIDEYAACFLPGMRAQAS